MNLKFNKFTKQLIIISIITISLNFALTNVVPNKFISSVWLFIALFFFAITLLVHRFLLKKADGNQGKFINAFMLSTTVKLLLYLSIILIYVLLNRNDAVGFIFTFFIYYLIYTVFEIVSILRFLREFQKYK